MSNKRIDLTQFEGMTEGPWEKDLDDDGKRWIDAYVEGEGDRNIARITNGSRQDADAIAAVPDLIAELKRCYEREDALIEALKIIRDDLDDALETKGYDTLAHEKSERTLQRIRNFANDASE